jgi:hypothetical protein
VQAAPRANRRIYQHCAQIILLCKTGSEKAAHRAAYQKDWLRQLLLDQRAQNIHCRFGKGRQRWAYKG